MLNWNWSYKLSTSVVALAIVSTIASPSAQAQSEVKATNTSSSLSTSLKVGETRSQSLIRTKDDSIARIHTHILNGRNAATVYVRGIPVVTYIDTDESPKVSSPDSQINTQTNTLSPSRFKGETKKNSNSVKLPANNTNNLTNSLNLGSSNSDSSSNSSSKSSEDSAERLLSSSNPIERATAAAALINQLSRDGIDANKIIPAWKDGNYVINLGDRATLKFDDQVIFPTSSQTQAQNQTQDVLESANLLRRLLGGANPVSEISDAPNSKFAIKSSFNPMLHSRVVGVMSGMASWYGPGFDGNYSASGELFNASDLTAAHPSLPFGTLVRVVNMDNGQSVVVRINDRGPYAHGRVIDISTAAANVIGLISSGVAPVRLEVLSK
ncbi:MULTISPECIES: septal ring lytic transglycosylase RlpA family protein [Pseudanabaena]|uniref:Probable endolytic peptidoglycan transglycosylase RlpA n=2 Tax=Pseudanabaena TaxID=1152 RepID=L8MVG9_9CYAN|nr:MULTISPECIES: septal ring lytic transglycosylase RlpA family protein [Pseudanabaena]ELS30764.1 rare lipoprotein A [Pseudanabaena biceps PCC 7429]MDG3496963.1 septal ring lytic transglycosylase RlpA family protein [Pseudanabaena catenata USMAC16]